MSAETTTDANGTDAKRGAPVKAPVKRASLDEDAPAAAPSGTQKTLPTGLSRAIVLAAVIFSFAFAAVGLLRDRYAIAPVPNSANSFVYRVDRLTGSLHFCGSQQCSVVHVRAAE